MPSAALPGQPVKRPTEHPGAPDEGALADRCPNLCPRSGEAGTQLRYGAVSEDQQAVEERKGGLRPVPDQVQLHPQRPADTGFLPQQLYERQAAVRATRQTRPWQANYAMRAAPGLSHSARAILMARDSSVHPSGQHLLVGLRTADCSVLRVMRTAGGWGSAALSAAGPVARRASAPARNPTAELPGTRARSRRHLPGNR